jgi:beta-lactamase superfamily II metal-dependent hydrolase
MKIQIFDVEHGFCAYIITGSNVTLIDAGHNSLTDFHPSKYLKANGCTGIERLVVSNYDEDHLSDLPDLRQSLPIQILRRNRSISADELEKLKRSSGPIAPGVQALLEMIRTYTGDAPAIDWGGATFTFFSNPYPAFKETNDLSLVTFLDYNDVHMVFPGDLEKAGWKALLQKPDFRTALARVKLFVASHHGRESGYCPEVLDVCKPWLVLISDEAVKYDTQDVNYTRHASGVRFGSETRYVLTTRADGMITVSQSPGDIVRIKTAR